MNNKKLKKRFILFFCLLISSAVLQAQDTVFLLKNTERPFLRVYRPNKKAQTGIAVVICSGGSYGRNADVEEGIPAAKFFAGKGITAFLCDYRVSLDLITGKDSIPFADAQRAITYVRSHAKTYGINPAKVGLMGFSAGGHLASTVATHWDIDFGNQGKAVSMRPDFLILVYPLISMRTGITNEICRQILLGNDPDEAKINFYSNELQVNEYTPPTYTVFSVDDPAAKVENGLLFDAALTQNKIVHKLFLYEKGGHGFGIYNSQEKIQWPDLVIPWILKEDYKAK